MKCMDCNREAGYLIPLTMEGYCSRHIAWWKRVVGHIVTFLVHFKEVRPC